MVIVPSIISAFREFRLKAASEIGYGRR